MSEADRPSSRCVVLVDFHAAGHHPTYLRLFAESLGEDLCAVMAPWSRELDSLPKSIVRLENFAPSLSRFWQWRGSYTIEGVERFRILRRKLKSFEKSSGKQITHVLFACLYDHQFGGAFLWRYFWRWNWSALYLHPIFQEDGELALRSWMQAPTLRCLALLDETRTDEMEAKTGKACVRMPDTVYAGCCESELRRRVRLLKGERFAIILSGFLHPQKGVIDFLNLVERLDSERFFFVMIGAIHLPDYEPGDQERLLRFSQEVENGLAYFHRVINEEVLNGLIEECDLVFAAYRDWKFSSNAVGKASAFRKPVVVTAGELMASRVERFGLGAAVSQGNVEEMADAVERWSEPGQAEATTPDWEGYLEEHSLEAFRESVSALVAGDDSAVIERS